MKAKILVVDDSKTDLLLIENMLTDYNTITAENGREALEKINQNRNIDLIILDLKMPVMNGFEFLKELNKHRRYQKLRTIILTNLDEIENEIKGLKLGAVDYIRKPINIESLRLRIDIHLKLEKARKKIEQDNIRLGYLVNKSNKDLMATQDITINALIGLLEVRDIESHNHTIRTEKMIRVLAKHLQTKEKFKGVLTDDYINALVNVTPLHDIGKVGVPDKILLKPAKLNKEEFAEMKKHVEYGANSLKDEVFSEAEIPEHIKIAIELIENHHEKYNGKGYPKQIKGENIPLPGRLMAIVDVYDAMLSKRVYKESLSHQKTLKYIKEQKGEHFDPDIAAAFLEINKKLHRVYKQYQ